MKKKSTSQPVRRPVLRSSSATEDGSPWLAVVFRRRLGEGGVFNLRVLIGLFVMLAGILLALLGFGTFSNASAQANVGSTTSAGQDQEPKAQQVGQMMVIPAV